MLKIGPKQTRAFDAQVEAAFIGELREALAAKYRQMLPSFPPVIQDQIVRNMVGRAARWGIEWQSSTLLFCEWMLSIAANFDDQPEIRRVLEEAGPGVDSIAKSLPDHVPDEVWQAAESQALDLPFFTPAEKLLAPLDQRVAHAIPVALHDLAARSNPSALGRESCDLAVRLGLGGSEDAPLVLAACGFLYGADFYRSKALSWTGDVFRPENSCRTRVAMLKCRIAMDHGRYV